jgi:tRNA A-37 threonylcarbamoyl transferase component Bud32
MDTVKPDPQMPEGPSCPQCGTPLQPGALTGLCPACLLQQGAAADSATEGGNRTFVPPTPGELARLFPQLEILQLIGKGGMGAVYKARQKQLDRIVALKILPPGIGDAPAFAERFAREARALALLNHPGIVTLYEFGKVNDSRSSELEGALYFFLMEYVDGVNLRQLLRTSRVSPREALAIVPQICDALQFAHDQGIVHRDIKPENILLDRRGRVKVADFGLAKIVAEPLSPVLVHPVGEGGASATGEGSPSSVVLTDAGKVMGTPSYMAPEQAERPSEVDHRADIYALGVVFYQMLTGELPGQPIAPPSAKVRVDVRLDEVVLRALEKQPELRYQQASALKTQVETIAAEMGPTPRQSPSGLAVAPEKPPWVAFSLALTYAGTLLFDVLCRLVRGGAPGDWLLAAFILLALLTPLLAFLVNRFAHAQGRRSTFKIAAWLAFVTAVPIIGFAAFFLLALTQERGGWNPAADEAVIVPLIWLGALLLPVCGIRLWRASQSAPKSAIRDSEGPAPQPGSTVRWFNPGESRVFAIIAVVALLLLTALGNAVAMLVVSGILLVAALVFWGSRHTFRIGLLVALAGLGVAAATVLLLNRKPPQTASMHPDAAGHVPSAIPLVSKEETTAAARVVTAPPAFPVSAALQFRWIAGENETDIPADLLPDPHDPTRRHTLRVLKEVAMDGSAVSRMGWRPNAEGNPAIVLEWNEAGRRRFAEITAANIGRRLAIMLDGQLLQAPRIAAAIESRTGELTGQWTESELSRILVRLATAPAGLERLQFGPSREIVLPQRPRLGNQQVFLNLRAALWLTNSTSRSGTRDFHSWTRESGADISAGDDLRQHSELFRRMDPAADTADSAPVPIVFFYDAVVVPAESNSWESATAPLVRLRWELMTDEPESESTFPVMPEGPDTFYLRTRDDTYCVMQVLGFSDQPRGIRIRYKVFQGDSRDVALQPDVAKNRAAGAEGISDFGPVIERVLQWGDEHPKPFLNFNNAKLFELYEVTGHWSGRDLLWRDDPRQLARLRLQGIDMGLWLDKGPRIVFWDCAVQAMSEAAWTAAVQLNRQHSAPETSLHNPYEQMPPPTSAQMLSVPGHWLIKTRSGALAVAHVASLIDRVGVTVRYRLFHPTNDILMPQSMPSPTGRILTEAPFSARLPDGEIEFLGISRFDPGNTNRLWWQPDGSPLTATIRSLNGSINDPERTPYELAFRVRPQTKSLADVILEAIPSVIRGSPWTGVISGAISGTDGTTRPTDTVFLQTLSCEPELTQVSLRIGVANGIWKTRRSFDFDNDAIAGGSEGVITLTVIPGEQETSAVCSYEEKDGWQTRLIASGPTGDIEPVRAEPRIGIGKTSRYVATFSTEQIKEAALLLQRRSYQWAEFHHVSLRPGHPTQIEVRDTASD